MAQQGIQGGGDRPEPKSEDREAPSAKLMESLGAERVRKEEEANKPAVEKFRETTDSIKDYFAEKMDQARAEVKTTFISGNETAAERSRESIQG
ncbi:hypothetical protein R1flu_014294 [Riccia fluitans]|uniref:Uncharacterized protein n=1 Tax=Riccia fluitans TaxID=41844 RepID=A0ABD1YFX4_9MARC